jgi:hypothetical protein
LVAGQLQQLRRDLLHLLGDLALQRVDPHRPPPNVGYQFESKPHDQPGHGRGPPLAEPGDEPVQPAESAACG